MEQADARERIQKLLVTGDNRLKQGVAHEKVRETYEEALRVQLLHGLVDYCGAVRGETAFLTGAEEPPAPEVLHATVDRIVAAVRAAPAPA